MRIVCEKCSLFFVVSDARGTERIGFGRVRRIYVGHGFRRASDSIKLIYPDKTKYEKKSPIRVPPRVFPAPQIISIV